jgi:tRNA (cytidine32/uridine32-2'-O)-methyltransferase
MSVRIVLTEPSHPGNIGAAARAMKNMGLSELYLVNPKKFPHLDATVRASGADDILESAVVVNALPDALVGCERVYATSGQRERRLEWPLCTPREAAQEIQQAGTRSKTAIVFGRECSGLTNAELAYSHASINIPTIQSFSSLNLGAAVQVIAYELYYASLSIRPVKKVEDANSDPIATADELNSFLGHLSQTMTDVKFLNPQQPRKLMQRLRRFFQRVVMTKTEVNILRGFLAAIDKSLKQ